MAVLQMSKIHIAALKRDKRKVIEFLQRQGTVEISATKSADNVYEKIDKSAKAERFQKQYDTVVAAQKILKKYAPEESSLFDSFEGRQVKGIEEFEEFYFKYEAILEKAEKIIELENRITLLTEQKIRKNELLTGLFPWESLTVPLNYQGTKNTAAFVGAVPKSYIQEEINAEVAAFVEPDSSIFVEIISYSKEQTCILAGALNSEKDKLEELLNELQFSYPVQRLKELPADAIKRITKEIEEDTALKERYEKDIADLEEYREQFKFLSDYLLIQTDKAKASSDISVSNYTFLLEGFVPKQEEESLTQQLEAKFDCLVNLTEPVEEDSVPSLMKNSWFSEPVESVVASFSYPNPTDVDPTTVTSIFYYLMFGLMFSDAGYGFILALACGLLLLKFKNMEPGTNKFLRLFFWCGVSTTFWGIIFSSYFGDVVNVVSRTFFGREVGVPPVWFSPLDNPMKLLIFCFALGIAHLVTGYLMNAYNAIKKKDFLGAVYDAGFPVGFLFSLLIIFVSTDMFKGMSGMSVAITQTTTTVCLVIAGLCALGIILTGGRESKSWVKRLLKGAFAFYNVMAGWISDILSYSRLLALGLATGVIGSVVNTLGAMVGKSVPGIIVFVLVFVAGHALNFGINILGSYVHSNRLEYVEFFGKFYEGGGRQFSPLKLNTKYYNIKEDVSNG